MTGRLTLKKATIAKNPLFETKSQLRGLLERYEKAEVEKARLINANAALFDTLAKLDDEQMEVKEAAKRLIFSRSGPPNDEDVQGKMWVPATGALFRMKIIFAKAASHYDPAKLPKDILTKPGVVTEVDTAAVTALKDTRVVTAFVDGAWKTPSLTIERNTRDQDTEEG